jgi:hypothetical protein
MNMKINGHPATTLTVDQSQKSFLVAALPNGSACMDSRSGSQWRRLALKFTAIESHVRHTPLTCVAET